MNSYLIDTCKKCGCDSFIEIYTGTDGLFSSKTFSHYKCNECNHECSSKSFSWVVDRNTVKEIIQKGLNNTYSTQEMCNELKKLGIYVLKPFKKTENGKE